MAHSVSASPPALALSPAARVRVPPGDNSPICCIGTRIPSCSVRLVDLLCLLLQVGMPLTLALRHRPGARVPRALGAQFRPATASSWPRGTRPELAAVVPRPGTGRAPPLFRPRAWMTTSQIASSAFTWGTVAVLPFYTLMVVAPNANITKRTVESSVPYVALGLLYGYLLFLSWTPETLRAMFASKYWLPELPGIVRMFASEMTVASAWIHLLAVDLFAARQVYHDGIKNNIETRHSVSLCLLFCPIGILAHVVTKVLAGAAGRSH
ncbi:hypothetical protein EJB05_31777, partial [Eragrostis curvula]